MLYFLRYFVFMGVSASTGDGEYTDRKQKNAKK